MVSSVNQNIIYVDAGITASMQNIFIPFEHSGNANWSLIAVNSVKTDDFLTNHILKALNIWSIKQ